MRKIDIYTIPLLFVCLAAAVLRSFALLTSFNSVTMHFDDKTAISIGGIIVVISVIASLSYLIFGEKEQPLIPRSDNAASYIPAGIVSTAMLFMGIYNINSFLNDYPKDIVACLSLISGILALLSIVSFFLSVFIERRDDLYKAAFSLSIVFFLTVYAAMLYFNKEIHPTNSPNRFIDEMAYLGAALFFLFEARIPLGRTVWRGYIAFGLVATLLCSYSSIPALVMYFATGSVIAESFIESILTLTLGILICSKVMQTKKLTLDAECDTAKSIAALASIREGEIRDRIRFPRAHDINDMEETTTDVANYTFDIPEANKAEVDLEDYHDHID